MGRPQKIIPTPDIVDNENNYVVAEVVDRQSYRNHKSKLQYHFGQYMVASEVYGAEENSWDLFEK